MDAMLTRVPTAAFHKDGIDGVKEELRRRWLNTSGSTSDVSNRLIVALVRDYADGWTLGSFAPGLRLDHLLNTMIVPFDGEGRDPETLVGQHLVEIKKNEDGTMTLEFSDGPDQLIRTRWIGSTATEVAFDDDDVDNDDDTDSRRLFIGDRHDPPLLILEAVTGIRRTHYEGPTFSVIGIECENTRQMLFFYPAKKGVLSPPVGSIGDSLLLEETKPIHENIVRVEHMLWNSG